MNDLFRFVKEEKEQVLYKFTSTEKKLSTHAQRQFLFPGTASGLFLCIISAFCINFSKDTLSLIITRSAGALGGVIIASSLVFYAMFKRQAKKASGTELYITDKNVIWCENESYAKIPLAEISDAYIKQNSRLSRIPFDLSELEGKSLILFYRGAEQKIHFIDDCDKAAEAIKRLTSKCSL